MGSTIYLDDEVTIQECEICEKLVFQKRVLRTIPLPERSNRWFYRRLCLGHIAVETVPVPEHYHAYSCVLN